MNILITTGIFPPDVGGPAKFVPLISKHLSNENEVRIITLSEDSKLNQDEKNQVYRIERNQNKIIRFLKTFLSIIKFGKNVEVIFVNGLWLEVYIANLVLRKKIVRKIVGDPVWEKLFTQNKIFDSFDTFQKNTYNFKIQLYKYIRNIVIRSANIIIVPSNHLYEFIWHEYCDWCIEFSKTVLWDENQDASVIHATQRSMLEILEATLRLAHPVMPFITEKIWTIIAPKLGNEETTIMLQAFPSRTDFQVDHEAYAEIEWLKKVVTGVRNIRGESKIKPSTKIQVLLQNGSNKDREFVNNSNSLLMRAANIESIQWLEANEEAPPHALALIEDLKLMVPLSGLIDLKSELARLNKELDKNSKEITRIESKLSNQKFVDNAPSDVVAKEKAKLEKMISEGEVLREQTTKLEKLK